MLLVVAITACSDEGGRLTVTTDPATVASSTAPVAVVPPMTTAASKAEAEADIRHAYATFSNVNVTQAERDAAVEDGEITSVERAARWEQFKGQAAFASFVINEIRFVSDTRAEVDFYVRYGNGPSPILPNIVHGGAVVQGGHWRVSRDTTCALSSAVGTKCVD